MNVFKTSSKKESQLTINLVIIRQLCDGEI